MVFTQCKSYMQQVECVNGDCQVVSIKNLCPENCENTANRLNNSSLPCGLIKQHYKQRPHYIDKIIENDLVFDDFDHYDEDDVDEPLNHMIDDQMFYGFLDLVEHNKQKNLSKKNTEPPNNKTKKKRNKKNA